MGWEVLYKNKVLNTHCACYELVVISAPLVSNMAYEPRASLFQERVEVEEAARAIAKEAAAAREVELEQQRQAVREAQKRLIAAFRCASTHVLCILNMVQMYHTTGTLYLNAYDAYSTVMRNSSIA